MRAHLQVLRQVWDAPGNRGHRLSAVRRAASWFARCRSGNPAPVPHKIFPGQWILPCYPDSIIAKHVMYRSEWYDWDLMHFMEAYLRPTDRYLDVGANIGLHLLMAARMVRVSPRLDLDIPDASPGDMRVLDAEINRLIRMADDLQTPSPYHERRLIAVEPNPQNLERLGETLRLNSLADEVIVLPVAAADHHGTMRLEGEDVFSRIREADGTQPGTEVRVERLDALLPAKTIHFTKIDVEGAEWQVLRGLENHLSKGLLPVIALELIGHAKVYGLEEEDMIAWLRDRGYRTALYRHDEKRLDYQAPPGGDVLALNDAGRDLIARRMGIVST